MKLHLSVQTDINIIRSYEPGEIRIGDRSFQQSLIVTPESINAEWRPQSPDDFQTQDFNELKSLSTDLIVLGTGARQVFPAHTIVRPLLDKGVGLEIMATPAACRTYNILAAEGRNVAAALVIP